MKKRKINYQKIFCFLSFIFLMTCVFWYGGRLIYFYIDNKKVEIENEYTLLSDTIIKNSNESLKNVDNDYYFYNNPENNYLTYSNILWRIVKINKDKEIILTTDKKIATLAYGKNKKYNESQIISWLNKTDEETGILETNLNNKDTYLTKTKTCIDNITNIEKTTCNEINKDYYIGLLSLTDYINTGGKDSFINNETYTYLSNTNEENIWYITAEGKVNTTDGNDIYAVKPTITLSDKNVVIEGEGTKENPYKIEETTSLFGSFVKLDNDIWRIYETNENGVKLVLNDYLTIDEEQVTHKYSNKNYYHNDTIADSLAYYLNNDYLNSLSYKDIINTDTYSNYYYSDETDFDFKQIIKNKIDTKVSVPSVSDIILNEDLTNYFTNTGTSSSNNKIFTINKNGTLTPQYVEINSNVLPCISINKDLLKKGSGTINDPYEME